MKVITKEYAQFRETMREIAGRVDPRKATMRWWYRPTLDPYAIGLELPPELEQVGREYFLVDPDVRLLVCVNEVRQHHPELSDEEWAELMRAAARRDASPDPVPFLHLYRR